MARKLAEYSKTTRKTTPVILNQRFSNVMRRAFNFTPPKNVDVERKRVRAYLRQPLATRIKLAKSGKSKGFFIKKASKNKQLQRVHLILNALRGKHGKKGFYGKQMLRASGAFVKVATLSVGFAKTFFMPIIKTMEGVVKFRGIRIRRGNLKIWNDPKSFSSAAPAKETPNPIVRFVVGSIVRKSDAKLHQTINRSIKVGIQAELNDLIAHLDRKAKENTRKEGVA